MSYKSPIEIIYGEMTHKLENEVFTAVQNIGINVDKDELIRALAYDRDQYHTGYSDAMMSAVEVVRCKDCVYYKSEKLLRVDGSDYFTCPANGGLFGPDDYCSSGERSEA